MYPTRKLIKKVPYAVGKIIEIFKCKSFFFLIFLGYELYVVWKFCEWGYAHELFWSQVSVFVNAVGGIIFKFFYLFYF